jgi:hypothetical protein
LTNANGLITDAGPGSGSKHWEALDREIGEPRKDREHIITHGKLQSRQLSTTERIAATLGPACGLPMWIQFFRPIATGRMEFSARLLLQLQFGIFQEARQLVPQGEGVVAGLGQRSLK